VSIFGSTVNGLACHGSDMDVTLLLNDYLKHNSLKQEKHPKLVQNNDNNNKLSNSNDGSNSSNSNMTEMDEHLDDLNEDDQSDGNINDANGLKDSLVKFFVSYMFKSIDL
jgi:hypothetical protein